MGTPWPLVRAWLCERWGVPPWVVEDPEYAHWVGQELEMADIQARYGPKSGPGGAEL